MLETMRRWEMLSPGETVAVGCSGGADSVCLLSLLADCADALQISVCAVHVHHGIRGAEADADERFVRDLCEARGIALTVCHADVPRIAAETGESIELCARRIRYDCFEKAAADKIATAHTASDAAETLLMNLARGSGLNGLCSIPPVRGRIIRPLIDCFRDETEAYCVSHEIGFVTDSTNASDAYTRNRLRHRVIPAMKEIFPAFENNVLRCVTLLREDAAFLDAEAEARCAGVMQEEPQSLCCAGLVQESPAIRRRVLRRFLAACGAGEAEARHILQLEAHLKDPVFSLVLPGGQTAVISDGTLRVPLPVTQPGPTPLPAEIQKDSGGVFAFGDYILALSVTDGANCSEETENNCFFVDFSKIDAIIFLRSRNPGDRITLPRRGCSKSLKKLMNEQKLPLQARDRMPVLADSRGVIFTPCAGVDASRLKDGEAGKALRIKLLFDSEKQSDSSEIFKYSRL